METVDAAECRKSGLLFKSLQSYIFVHKWVLFAEKKLGEGCKLANNVGLLRIHT